MGLGQLVGLGFNYAGLTLFWDFYAPCHVKLTSLRESTPATAYSGNKIRLRWFSNYKRRNVACFQRILGLRFISIHTEQTVRPHQTNSAGKSKRKRVCYTEEKKQFISIKTRQKPRIQNPDVHLKGFLHIGEPV